MVLEFMVQKVLPKQTNMQVNNIETFDKIKCLKIDFYVTDFNISSLLIPTPL